MSVDAISSLVRLKIPMGERPPLEELRSSPARPEEEEEEEAGLIALMKRCWDGDPSQRPTSLGKTDSNSSVCKDEGGGRLTDVGFTSSFRGVFAVCAAEAETAFIRHKEEIVGVVHQVLTEMVKS